MIHFNRVLFFRINFSEKIILVGASISTTKTDNIASIEEETILSSSESDGEVEVDDAESAEPAGTRIRVSWLGISLFLCFDATIFDRQILSLHQTFQCLNYEDTNP